MYIATYLIYLTHTLLGEQTYILLFQMYPSISSIDDIILVAEDYNPVLETLTFGHTSNHTCFNFTTLEDEIHEEDMEDLNLHLSTMIALNVTLDPFLAHVRILDDDSK